MTIEEYANAITKHLMHDKNYRVKTKLNSIYGKQIYNLSKSEKEYLINDVRSTFFAYTFNRCCGKTVWLNSHYIDTDSVKTIQESKTRTMARIRLSIDTKIRSHSLVN